MINEEVIELIKEKVQIQETLSYTFTKMNNGESTLDMSETKSMFSRMDEIQREAISKLNNDMNLYVDYISLVNSLNNDNYEYASQIRDRILNEQQ
jgi:hypothetical protein